MPRSERQGCVRQAARSIDRAVLLLLASTVPVSASQYAPSAGQSFATGSATAPAQPRKQLPLRQFGVWFALGLHSTIPTRLGESFRNFYLVGLRYTREIQTDRGLAADYTIDVLPLAVSTHMPDYSAEPKRCSTACPLAPAPRRSWHTAVGLGLAPLGLQIRMGRSRPIQPFINVDAGALWFQRRIPDPEATQFNFMAQFGGGMQIRAGSRHRLTLGYQYHHTSNGGLGNVNPGLNSWLVLVGMSQDR